MMSLAFQAGYTAAYHTSSTRIPEENKKEKNGQNLIKRNNSISAFGAERRTQNSIYGKNYEKKKMTQQDID